MITVKWTGGRFGNQLFAYSFARLVAKRFNYSLKTDLLKNGILKSTPTPVGIEYPNDPVYINDVLSPGYCFPNHLDKRHYVVHGLFQDSRYYYSLEKLIQSFFEYEKPKNLNKTDIVAHVRLTDYKEFGPGGTVIHPQWYTSILDQEDFEKLYLVTDEPNDQDYFRPFKQRYNCEIVSESAKNDFFFLMNFDKILMSNSTFAWWAVMLGDQSKIYTFKPWIRNCTDYFENWKIKNSIPVEGTFLNY